MAATTRPAPDHMGAAGTKLWTEIASFYDLRPDEYRLLEDACREADLIEVLADEQREQPVMITGSTGQQVLNPLIAEVRQHRGTLSTLLTKLKLPDDPETGATGQPASAGDDRASQARAAANARWSRRGA
jgi:hypothetical protein